MHGLVGLRPQHNYTVAMPRPQVAVLSKKVQQDVKLSNPFSALADTDSDEENEMDKEHNDQQQQSQQKPPTPQPSPPFRTWAVDGDEKRWNLDGKKNIFSSPFSKQKRTSSRPYQPESKEGWTSIRLPEEYEAKTPPFPETQTETAETQEKEKDEELPKLDLPPQEFPSLFTRGNAKGIVLETTIPTPSLADSLENVSALMWAERIKRSLERAEQIRAEKARQPTASAEDLMRSVGRLSFFRRSLPTDEEEPVASQ